MLTALFLNTNTMTCKTWIMGVRGHTACSPEPLNFFPRLWIQRTHTHTQSERAHPPDAVVVPHQKDALGVRQVAVVYEEVEDAPGTEPKLVSDQTLQVRDHPTRV